MNTYKVQQVISTQQPDSIHFLGYIRAVNLFAATQEAHRVYAEWDADSLSVEHVPTPSWFNRYNAWREAQQPDNRVG